ncbi:16S/23S rRNA (cytidine-2'-O)-methyltransferase TlyA [Austwickia sp. TVS 96-490-7B]|uniref:TlyA family RNA methyltransferase n=1 Tax=Austwickia sp. TVS 96-490-7B TaxID=2830843 RepID=UPI001DE556FA|nr:TlyA family RNA methyltransferase [Austwickia sp. TVS 96-490-7B]MBW3086968.1 16S/23S rRNA (cytidine-2'-O)-methyltransferase TlyA [Austwickia sp. TVS 96-490-7B]
MATFESAPVSSTRLDVAMVTRGMTRSRNLAAELIRDGKVTVDGRPIDRPASRVHPDTTIQLHIDRPVRVGRAGHKLDIAFTYFGAIDPEPLQVTGQHCLDIGASTGGFTQVLLEHGAAHVTALDVGHNQLVPELAADPRVRDLSGTNIRDVSATQINGPFPVIVADLSFISLRLVLPTIASLLSPGGQAVVLVKPQFEAGRQRLSKQGVVRDPRDRRTAILNVIEAVRDEGLFPRAVIGTGIPGGAGNHEYLMWVTTRPEHALVDEAAAVDDAIHHFGRTR